VRRTRTVERSRPALISRPLVRRCQGGVCTYGP
jgi:hypothetical protein